MITITEKPPAHELNGVLRFINVRYNISQEQEKNYSLRIDHEVFFNSSAPFSFILPNLLAFTVYRMHISYVTVGRGPETNVTMRTLIDSKGLLVTWLISDYSVLCRNLLFDFPFTFFPQNRSRSLLISMDVNFIFSYSVTYIFL